MGKVKWGVIAAIAAVIAVVLLATQGVFTTGGESSETAGSSKTSVEEEAGQDAATPTVDEGRADSSGRAADAAGDEASPAGSSKTSPKHQAGQEARTRAVDEGSTDSTGPTAETAVDEASPAAVGSDDSAASSTAGSGEEPDERLQKEAESFVQQLAEPSDEPVPLEDAEAFVGGERPLAAREPDGVARDAAPSEAGDVAEAGAATAGRPGRAEPGSDSASEAEPGPEAESAGTTRAGTSVADSGDSPAADAGEAGTTQTPQANVELPLSEETPITIAELLAAEETIPSNAVFYVHTVRPDDNQGIWGIVHDGIVNNFATGVAIHRGESTETYRVDIPRNADERKPDASSSFLGRLIHEKSQKTYVYNYQADRLGKNPDLIIPGQEIVIVSFTPEELIEIYKHFVRGG